MSKKLIISNLLIVMLLILAQTVHATKRALVIGIGQQEDRRWEKISGDKDVPYVMEMLKKAGYQDIRTLINQQATKVAIVSAFKSLANSCHTGDMVYIHFSGHGQQMTDANGDEGKDGLDEAWIPYDAYIRYSKNYHGENHLVDDEVSVLLTNIRKHIGNSGKMLVVVDACHSGDSDRGSGEIVRGTGDVFRIPVKQRGHAKKSQAQWLMLSACKDKQVNFEMKNLRVGKLTYALYSLAGKGLTMKKIADFMERNRISIPQTPELTGDKSKYNISEFFK